MCKEIVFVYIYEDVILTNLSVFLILNIYFNLILTLYFNHFNLTCV